MPSERPRGQAGFTLIEAVLVISLTGIVLAVVSVFIAPVIQAYLANVARTQLTDHTDTALRRMARDLARALPNSVRVSNSATTSTLELVPVNAAARYAVEGPDPLEFGTPDLSFAIVGPALNLQASQQVAFYNLGQATPDADVYSGSNRRQASNGAGPASTVNLSANAGLPVALFAPPYRAYAVDSPISYHCDLSAGTLTRYSGYGFNAVQAAPPVGGSAALLARDVSACRFTADQAVVAARAGLINLSLSLTQSNETVALHHAIHVDNLP